MPATEITTKIIGHWGGKEILEPTGGQGNVFPSYGDWLVQRMNAQIKVNDVTNTVVVRGAKQWVAFEETMPQGVLRTVLVIT